MGTIVCADAEVCCFLAWGEVKGIQKGDCSGALDGSVCSTAVIEEATNFTSVGLLPYLFAGAFAKLEKFKQFTSLSE